MTGADRIEDIIVLILNAANSHSTSVKISASIKPPGEDCGPSDYLNPAWGKDDWHE